MTTRATLQSALQLEFSPALDSSLLAALLLDYPPIISPSDEASIRSTLTLLADGAHLNVDGDDGERGFGSDDDRLDESVVQGLLEAWCEEDRKDREAEAKDAEKSSAGPPSALDRPEAVPPPEAEPEPIWALPVSSPPLASPSRVDADPPPSDDPLTFLSSVFPRLPVPALRARLESSSDLETLLEELLSEQYISSSAFHIPTASSSVLPPASARPNSKQRRREKHSLKSSLTLSLTSPSLLPPSSSSSSPLPSPTPLLLPTSFALHPSLPSANLWTSVTSTVSFLAPLVRLTPQRLSSLYHSHSCSLPLTLHTLLTTLPLSRPPSSIPNFAALLESLTILLPAVDVAECTMLLCVTEGDVSDAMDLCEFVKRTEREEGGLLGNGLLGFGKEERRGDAVAGLYSRDGMKRPVERGGEGWDVVDHSVQRGGGGGGGGRGNPTPEECKSLVAQYEQKRNDAFRSAARCFQRGNSGNRGAAWYWAEVGREFDRKKRSWEKREAFAVVDQRSGRDSNTIDLHGLTLHQALAVVQHSCNTWYSSSSSPRTPLKIVTGLGKHSANQNPILMPAVRALLDREGWRWKWDGVGGGGKGAMSVVGLV